MCVYLISEMRKLTPNRQVKFFSILTIFSLGICICYGAVCAAGVSGRDQAHSLRNQGLQLQNKGNVEGALSYYLKAHAADPGYAVIYNDLGVVYEAQGETDRAEAHYLRAVRLDPSFAGAYSNLALLYENKRDLRKASEYWKKRVAAGKPDDPWTKKAKQRLLNIGTFPYDDFKPQYSLSQTQKQARKYREEGLERQRLGDIDEAYKLYLKAKELDPAFAPIYNDLGIIYEMKGMTRKAEAHYKKALQISPRLVSAYSNLALLYEHRRELKKAAQYWKMRKALGEESDPWALKAERRSGDIDLVLHPNLGEDITEQDVLELVESVSWQKESAPDPTSPRFKARAAFAKAQLSLKRGDEMTAYRHAIDAYQLDPQDKKIRQFLLRIQKSLLSK